GSNEVYQGPGGKWSVAFPRGWHATTIGGHCSLGGYSGGAIVSNVDFRFRHPSGGLGQCDGRFVMAGFPRHGVALALQPLGLFEGVLAPEPETAFPLGLSNLIGTSSIRGGPSESYMTIWVGGQPRYGLRVWFGRAATLREPDTVLRIVESIRFSGAPRWVEYRDPSIGISLQRPSNWFVSQAVANS